MVSKELKKLMEKEVDRNTRVAEELLSEQVNLKLCGSCLFYFPINHIKKLHEVFQTDLALKISI